MILLIGNRPCPAEPLQKIVLLESMPVPAVLEHSRWFLSELKALGYEVGTHLNLVRIQADGSRKKAVRLLKQALSNGRPDLVVTNATLASQTAASVLKGTGIPILFLTVSDPVGAGLIEAVGKPTGTAVTGKVYTLPRNTKIDLVMRLARQVIPDRTVRFGFIHSSYPSSMGDFKALDEEARKRGDCRFIPFQVGYRAVPDGLEAMLDEVRNGIGELEDQVDFWFEPSGPLGELPRFTRVLLKASDHPVIFGTKLKSVRLGALMHLTPSMEPSGREAAALAVAILKGRPPGEIPPTPPSAFELGLNLTTALKLGIVIPPDILALAGENIFH